jgi:hypothetical protein
MRKIQILVTVLCIAAVVLASAAAAFYFLSNRGEATGLAALRVPPGFIVEKVAGPILLLIQC